MASEFKKPKVAIVFDVNVILDAIEGSGPRAEAAARALAMSSGNPVYMSDMMLKTITIKLLEHGADPDVVKEYLELITDSDDLGDNIHTFEKIKVTQYDLVDKFGNPDYEDATVVSLMDAAEKHATAPALLVTSDGAFRDWCHDNKRMAVRPDQLQRLLSEQPDELRQGTYQYLGRRMFKGHTLAVEPAEAKVQATRMVVANRTEFTGRRTVVSKAPPSEESHRSSEELEL